jgi:hypothetical protein
MYIPQFDSGTVVLENLQAEYIRWFDPLFSGRTISKGKAGSGTEFCQKLSEFYYSGPIAFRIFDLITSTGKVPNASAPLYGNILWISFSENWNGQPSYNWFKQMELPPFILNHPLWTTTDKNTYLDYFLASSHDKQGILLEKLFDKVIIIYQQWLLDNMMDDDMGVLNSFRTRLKSTHYWAIHVLFWFMCYRLTSRTQDDIPKQFHQDPTMEVPYFPKLPVPGPGFLYSVVNDLQRRVMALEKKNRTSGKAVEKVKRIKK